MRKKVCSIFLAMMMLISMFATTALAADVPAQSDNGVVENQTELTMRIVTPEEMDSIIAGIQNGTIPLNWFDDIVAVSGKRVQKSDGTEYFSLTLLNTGFVFDRVDVDGNIKLYDSGRLVANKAIDEPKLVFGFSRVIDIYPLGGHYTTGTYSLRVSDGDAGTTYTGSVADLGG